VTVAQLIAVLQKLNPGATVVAPFSPNASEINVEEVGGVFLREKLPFPGAIELTRARHDYTNSEEASAKSTVQAPGTISQDILAIIRNADSDAPV
jgi:hypothetical protein